METPISTEPLADTTLPVWALFAFVAAIGLVSALATLFLFGMTAFDLRGGISVAAPGWDVLRGAALLGLLAVVYRLMEWRLDAPVGGPLGGGGLFVLVASYAVRAVGVASWLGWTGDPRGAYDAASAPIWDGSHILSWGLFVVGFGLVVGDLAYAIPAPDSWEKKAPPPADEPLVADSSPAPDAPKAE